MNEQKRRRAIHISDIIETGKLQPQAIELEEGILGAVLLEKNAYHQISELIKAEHFYKEAHVLIWKAIETCFSEGVSIDILTISNQLRKNQHLELVGGAHYITELTNRVASAANIKHHAHVVLEKFIQRELIRISSEIQREAFEDTTDPFELRDRAIMSLNVVTEDIDKAKEIPLKTQLQRAVQTIEDAAKNDNKVGKRTGFNKLDALGGLVDTDLIILAARPAIGKSALLVQIMTNVAEIYYPEPIVIFSLEMSATQLFLREITRRTGIDHEKVRKGILNNYDWENVNKQVGELGSLNIYLFDQPYQTTGFMRRKLSQIHQKHGGIGLVGIDYMQLVKPENISKNATENDILTEISWGFKNMAKEFDTPIIALSQLSREVDKRPDKRPVLADLRSSGSIEQTGDKVIFIYRDEYYGILAAEDGSSTEGVAEIRLSKNRSGPCGKVFLHFDAARISFMDSNPNTIKF